MAPDGPRAHAVTDDVEGVAMIGMAGRFPGAGDISELWENLRAGVESVSFFDDEELRRAGIDPEAVRDDPQYVRAQAVLEGADLFDAAFFAVNPKEAELMDPQHRHFLETSWEALEDAGYDPAEHAGPIGVFAGANKNSYFFNNIHPHRGAMEPVGVDLAELGNEKDYLPTRVSYKLDLRGPSVSIHTACSTSLVAVHHACQAVLGYQCDLALAGGVCVRVPQTAGYRYQETSVLSPDGHCRPYDARAQGTVGGSGVGVVVLKRLSEALAHGDHIYAIIRGSAVNNDGASKLSFSAPSVDGQADVIAMAQALAGVSPETITYLEGHGTATPLGDPIEVAALTQAFRRGTTRTGYCALGSIKSNFGHLDSAAGVAGLIKTALSLYHRQIPPTVNFEAPNPRLEIESSPFFVSREVRDWESNGTVRRAGVSSFGIGGTNAHAVLEEAPPRAPRAPGRRLQLLPLSARSEGALEAATDRLVAHLERHADLALEDVAYTLQVGRRAFDHRRFVVCRDRADAVAWLRARDPEHVSTGRASGRGRSSGRAGDGAPAESRTEPPEAAVAALGRRWLEGESVDWRALHAGSQPRRVPLPTYPFERKRYWILPPAKSPAVARADAAPPADEKAALDSGGRRERIYRELREIVSEWSGTDEAELDGDATFVELGFDSLLLNQVNGELQKRFPVKIAFRQLFEEAPSLTALADYIDRRLDVEPGTTAPEPAPHGAPVRTPRRGAASRVAASRQLDGEDPSVVFMFPGQGAQHVNMGRDLYQASRTFREHVDAGAAILLPTLGVDVRDLLYPPPDREAAAAERLRETSVTQPVLFVVEHALACLWRERGVEPSAMIGHSVGEYTAACVAGVFDFEDTVRILATRARLMQARPRGGMLAVRIPAEELERRIHEPLALAASNAPMLCVVSGPSQALDAFREELAREDIETTPLHTSHAYHSSMMDEVIAPFVEAFAGVTASAPRVPWISSVSGTWITAEQATDPHYWARQLRGTVRFSEGMKKLTDSFRVFLEVGPGTTLTTFAQQHFERGSGPKAIPSLGHARSRDSALDTMRAAEDGLSVEGVPLGAPAKPFGAIARIELGGPTQLEPSQREWLDRFVARYTARTATSRDFTEAHRDALADPRVVSGFTPLLKELTYPIAVERSQGAHVWDLDGNEYVDVISGFGSNFLGYGSPVVVRAIEECLARGYAIGPQDPVAGEVARLMTRLTGHPRTAFCNTGSEAVLGAVRAARTVTGRSKVVLFRDSYHGILDEFVVRGVSGLRSLPAASGIPRNAVAETLILDYGEDASLEVIREHASAIAAVLVEPVQSRHLALQPREFLHALREVTSRAGIALVFDEIITGFRVGPGGAQAHFGVRADVATYGKVVGGGLPIGLIAGSARFMDALDGGSWSFGDDSFPRVGVTYFAGTFVRHPLALAAARAVLTHLEAEGDALPERVAALTARCVSELESVCSRLGAPIRFERFASAFQLYFTTRAPFGGLLFPLLRERRIHAFEGRTWFLTAAHTDQDVRHLVDGFRSAVSELLEVGLLQAATPSSDQKGGLAAERSPALVSPGLSETPPVPGARLGRDPDGRPGWFSPDPSRPGKFVRVGDER